MLEITSAEPVAVSEEVSWSQNAFEEELFGHSMV